MDNDINSRRTEHRTGSNLSEAEVKLLTEAVSTAISFHASIVVLKMIEKPFL